MYMYDECQVYLYLKNIYFHQLRMSTHDMKYLCQTLMLLELVPHGDPMTPFVANLKRHFKLNQTIYGK